MLNRQNTIRSGLLASFFALFVFLIAAVNIWSAWVLATILYILFVSKMLIMASKDIK
jgi:hypothetical protein